MPLATSPIICADCNPDLPDQIRFGQLKINKTSVFFTCVMWHSSDTKINQIVKRSTFETILAYLNGKDFYPEAS